MLTRSSDGRSTGDSQRNAIGSAVAGIVALAIMLWPALIQFPEGRLVRIGYWPLKILETTGLLTVMGVAILVISLLALILGYVGNPRTSRLAVLGLATGGAALMLLIATLALSSLQGRLWLIGFGFTLAR
jgi:hypothetical protein